MIESDAAVVNDDDYLDLNFIPYVADFALEIGTSTSSAPNQLRWFQYPGPRPFYCTVFAGDGSHPNWPATNDGFAFGWVDFQFFTMSDSFAISVNQLKSYAETAPTWSWNDPNSLPIINGVFDVTP